MTTYARLLAGAAEEFRLGAAPLRTDRFWTTDQAMGAIADFRAVLDAVATHTRTLLWPAQIQRLGHWSHRRGLPDGEAAAVALAAGIESLVGARRPHPSQLTAATTPWLRTAMHLRAASDLLATHFRPDGQARTPDGANTDARALDAGLADLGHFAGAVFAAEEPLALRALQAGLNRNLIARHLPGLEHLSGFAGAMTANPAGTDEAARTRLAALPQTWTPVRTGAPVDELADRMHRLRQVSFTLAAEPADALPALRDITTIGIAVHAHAAAFHGARPSTAPEPPPGARGAQAFLLRGRAWQALHRDLSQFTVLTRPHDSVREDLLAVTRLLAALAPLESRTNTAALADPTARRTGAGLNGAISTMTGIGDHSAEAFATLARTGGLLIDARQLPRDVVTDDPALVDARIKGGYVHPPAVLVDAILDSYDVVRAHPTARASSPFASPGATSLVERDIAVLARDISR